MNLNTLGKLLSFGEVPDADPKPGLYAWYLRIKPGKSNLESPENFSKALKRITEELCYPDLSMQLRGHLNLHLKGDLKHIWYGHEENRFSDQFQKILELPEEREILGEILESTVPLLTGPLYIGVSKNLQLRLEQHVQLIQGYQEDTIQYASIDSEESLENDKNFAQRIIERQIDPNHLMVGIVYLSHPQFSGAKIRKAIGAAEILLNRMFYPILGRK